MEPHTGHYKRTVEFSKDAINVFFHILTRCNLQCAHCYINQEQHGRETLPVDRIQRWLDAFLPGEREVNVIFLGGEPTLHPDLASAAAYARRAGYASVTIDTNGYLFNNILDKTTPAIIDYISFSLDGATATTNDAIRGAGSYKRCIEGIGKAVAKGFSTSLIYTVSTANICELDDMTDLVTDLGVDRVFIQVLGIRGRSGTGESNTRGKIARVSKRQWESVVPAAAQAMAKRGITVTYPKVFLSDGEKFECAGLVAENYFVFPNGRVYRCPLCEDFPIHGMAFENDRLVNTPRINETDLFCLNIPEGCVMNRLVQPGNISYGPDGVPEYRIACCMLKEEVRPA